MLILRVYLPCIPLVCPLKVTIEEEHVCSPLRFLQGPILSSRMCRWPRHRICKTVYPCEARRQMHASTLLRIWQRTAKAPTLLHQVTSPRSNLPALEKPQIARGHNPLETPSILNGICTDCSVHESRNAQLCENAYLLKINGYCDEMIVGAKLQWWSLPPRFKVAIRGKADGMRLILLGGIANPALLICRDTWAVDFEFAEHLWAVITTGRVGHYCSAFGQVEHARKQPDRVLVIEFWKRGSLGAHLGDMHHKLTITAMLACG